MSFFIVYGGEVLKQDPHVTESKDAFVQRLNFLIAALDAGFTLQRAQTLSQAYKNKIQSYMRYPKGCEEDVEKVLTSMTAVVIAPKA
jgi:hypothetical protein